MVNISPDCHSNIPCEVQAGSVGKKDTVVAFSTVHMWQSWLHYPPCASCSIPKLSKAAKLFHFLARLLLDACSLVLRPSHHKNGGVRPGPFYYVNDVSVYQGRQRGGEWSPIERMYFAHAFFVLNQKQYVFRSADI